MIITCKDCGRGFGQVSPLVNTAKIMTLCCDCAQPEMVEVRANIPVALRDQIEKDRAARQLATGRVTSFADVAGDRLALLSFVVSEKVESSEAKQADVAEPKP